MWPFSKKQPAPQKQIVKSSRRGYDASKTSRLTGDFSAYEPTANSILGSALPALRNRSRNLIRNNGYMKKYWQLIKVNVLGAEGIRLRSAAITTGLDPDEDARKTIETAWALWGKWFADYYGELTWGALERQILRAILVDGECLLRQVRGAAANNPFNYSIQAIPAEFITDLNRRTANGGSIINGIELDSTGKEVAVWVYTSNPNANMFSISQTQRMERVPKADILHVWVREDSDIGTTRGVPWATPVMLDTNMIAAVMDAETVKARVDASKMGIITESADGMPYEGQGEDDDGSIIDEVSPGILMKLRPGQGFEQFDVSSKSDLPAFIKAILRKVSCGFGVNYNSLASDLEGVNFSSLRGGYLEDQENYKTMQTWLFESLHQKIYREWLSMALLSGQLGGLGMLDKARLMPVTWLGRRWPWIDPLKDAQAAVLLIDNGIESRQAIIRNRGRDPEVVDEELSTDTFTPKAEQSTATETDQFDDEINEENGGNDDAE